VISYPAVLHLSALASSSHCFYRMSYLSCYNSCFIFDRSNDKIVRGTDYWEVIRVLLSLSKHSQNSTCNLSTTTSFQTFSNLLFIKFIQYAITWDENAIIMWINKIIKFTSLTSCFSVFCYFRNKIFMVFDFSRQRPSASSCSNMKNRKAWRIRSLWMWRCVALVRTDVSEDHIASIIRVKRIIKLGTLAVTSNWSMLGRNT
jgi:hypothetical protein